MEDQASLISKKNLADGFVQMPTAVLTRSSLSANAKIVYAILLSFMRGKGYCYPSHKKIGGYIGKSRFTVMKYLNELEDYKLVRVKYRGNKRTNIYYQNALTQSTLVANLNSGVASLPQENVADLPHQYVAKSPHEVYEVNNRNNNYIKTINRDKNGKFKKIILGQFNKQAELLAKELNDELNLKFYISLESKIKTGLINFTQILNSLQLVKDKLRTDQADGNKFWQNPAAIFNDQILRTIEKNKINKSFIPDLGMDTFNKDQINSELIAKSIEELVKDKGVPKEKTYFEKQQELNTKRNQFLDDLEKITDENL